MQSRSLHVLPFPLCRSKGARGKARARPDVPNTLCVVNALPALASHYVPRVKVSVEESVPQEERLPTVCSAPSPTRKGAILGAAPVGAVIKVAGFSRGIWCLPRCTCYCVLLPVSLAGNLAFFQFSFYYFLILIISVFFMLCFDAPVSCLQLNQKRKFHAFF